MEKLAINDILRTTREYGVELDDIRELLLIFFGVTTVIILIFRT